MAAPLNYTTWANVTNLLKRTFPEITPAEQNFYLAAGERYIENFLGYNEYSNDITTTSGILSASITREKSDGMVDANGTLVVTLKHPPIHLDVNANPIVSLLTINGGVYEISLQLTDGSTAAKNSIIEYNNRRNMIYYPASYLLPMLTSVTPTQKINLSNLRGQRFWTDVSYVGGYELVPDDIAMAATFVTADFVIRRDNPNYLVDFRQGSLSQTFEPKSRGTLVRGFNKSKYLEAAELLLQSYARVTP